MRWLVTGAGGMLGREMVSALASRGEDVDGRASAALDITDADAVADAVAGHDVVVNTAAWTDVDGAERSEESAMRVNGNGAAYLAAACESAGATLIHISTDYVFDGGAADPYPEDAATNPLSAYGRSKLAGETAVARLAPTRGHVVRTAWLYGSTRRNFVTTMMRLAKCRDMVGVVDDQWGQPTWSRTLADRLVGFGTAAHGRRLSPGIYHATSDGVASWYALARAVFEESGLDRIRVYPIRTDQYPLPAQRPMLSVLSGAKWAASGMRPLGNWRAQVAEAMPAILNDLGV
jgi:dTDP-4-dehydrorhamnose reductase